MSTSVIGMRPQRVCTKCGESKPATTAFFHRDKLRGSGLSPACKSCRAAEFAAWKQKARPTIADEDFRAKLLDALGDRHLTASELAKEMSDIAQRIGALLFMMERDGLVVRAAVLAGHDRSPVWCKPGREATLDRSDLSAPREAAVDRARYILTEPATLTGRLLGDPPVGRSAYDKKMAALAAGAAG